MDTLVSMKVFRHVVEVGSFVGAAERMDQPIVEHRHRLERDVAAELGMGDLVVARDQRGADRDADRAGDVAYQREDRRGVLRV